MSREQEMCFTLREGKGERRWMARRAGLLGSLHTAGGAGREALHGQEGWASRERGAGWPRRAWASRAPFTLREGGGREALDG